MTQLIVAVAVFVAVAVGSFTIGRQNGYGAGHRAGQEKGYQDATRTLNATHREAVERLNRQAAETLLGATQAAERARDTELAIRADAENVAAIELARIAGERDAHARRVRELLRARVADSNQGGCRPVPQTATDTIGNEGTAAGGLLLDRIGTHLAGLADTADETLAQYRICHRLATRQKKELDDAQAGQRILEGAH